MRLNLGCGNDVRTGYINVDRLPISAPPELFKLGDIQTIDWLTEDKTVEEIVALDCLEYLPLAIIPQTLANWANKLVQGGIIKILIPDCHSIAKSFTNGQFNLYEFAQMILGTQQDGDIRMSVIDTATLIDILHNVGLTVITKRYDGVAFYVEAQK